MLPKAFRLNSQQDISKVLKIGRRKTSHFFVAISLSQETQKIRFGFLISKKVSNQATKRNLARRRLRHIVAGLIFRCRPGLDCLLVARPPILTADYQILQKEVSRVLTSLGCLK